ncbi:hypothetical protein JCM9140_3233 [Halalkalibacter wakoensis JCM 9140]|uniref:Uncharacterized protein n=1 Tax=Halalkalibacter wakoensis JCM 9140 TaxID=1236970 RepID=W4Q542_9BACI|nr:hypothetical protein [Halalkalibacter wakoensis]GAE27117.1 hypothetical protein JCM9140_3233 [Halalkalibacter wakoensis JCM 9140]
MYRPTVRYDDAYKQYVENVFNSTHLDKSQIIRAALFIAGHTEQFSRIVEPYLKKGMSLPVPLWSEGQDELWLNQKATVVNEPQIIEKAISKEQPRYQKRRVEEQPIASPKVFSPGGGVSIKFGGGGV